MTVSDLLIVGFAAFAVTYLLRYVNGPFNLFYILREFIDIYVFLSQLFSCFWCLGFWVGCLTLVIYVFVPQLVYVFCVLGILGLAHEVIAE